MNIERRQGILLGTFLYTNVVREGLEEEEREREMASHLLLTRDRCFGRLRNILRW